MKKFVLETKAALGVAPKTVDREFDEAAAKVKAIDHALSDYKSAMERMKSASQALVTAMESVSKAFETMSAGDDVPASIKAVSTDYAEVVKKAHYEYIVDYKKATEDNENVTDLKNLTAECKKLEAKRNKVMSEYDTYRDSVSKKEAEYSKKGKSLTDSKHYNEEVSKRDSLKSDFENADKEFKDKFAELETKKHSSYMAGMSSYLASTSQFIASIEHEMSAVKSKAAAAKV
ncbi:hypothetical protein NESM_000064400 [Novymonas esmeraldas]|uniref:Uncharacterized protein n=1 Tax=Novymonas esmeraldas TaxID=1808958 RepID=A0AAW0F3Z7_9TRYP